MTTASASNPPTQSTVSQPGLAALLYSVGVAPLTTGWIRVTGSDRVRWLNGMATNSVQALTPGHGAYNFFLNAQGRIQGDGYIFATTDALLLETAQAAALIPYLDHYIIMDDVELSDISDSRRGVALIGPEAPALLARLGLTAPEVLTASEQQWDGAAITVIHIDSPLVPRFELWLESSNEALLAFLKQNGATSVEDDALNALRLLEGTPLYGTDIRDRDLPQETNQTRALHFNKGCYLGQEIVERIRSRGAVHRTFTAFRLTGELPASGTALESAGKPAGELTSIVSIPVELGEPLQLALGYARREALERHEPLTYPGGTAHPITAPADIGIKISR